MRKETNKFRSFSKKKKTDKSFSKKINFYRTVTDLPEVIDAKDYQSFIKPQKKGRLGKKKEGWYNGSRYDSRWEARYAQELDLRKKIGEIRDWSKQVTIQINVANINNTPVLTDETGISLKSKGINYHHICNYRIDFVIELTDGSKEFVEIKGYRTELWTLKWKLFESLFTIIHPEYKIRIIN